MSAAGYYALTALPALEPPGAAPPLPLAAFLERIPDGPPQRLARAVLLIEDLHLREAVLAGEVEDGEPAVLTGAQLAGRAPLPPELEPAAEEPASPRALPVDSLWEACFAEAARVARRCRSRFLEQWVGTEVRLRNELARARARALALKDGAWLVARPLELPDPEVDAAVRAWQDAPDPLTGLRSLLSARWQWIEQHQPVFTFTIDEYPAYAAKLALLHRWQRSGMAVPAANRSGGVGR